MGRFFQVTPTEFQSQFTPLPMEFMYQTIKEKQLEVDNVNKASDIFKQAVKWGRGTEKEGKELTEWLKSKTEDVEKSLSSGDYQTAVSKLSQYNKELKSDWRWHKATQDFHYRDKVDEMLRSSSEKGDIATFLDPTGGIRQMEGKSFNPAHYGVVPYADYWGEEFDPQITDKLTASVQAYLSDPNVKVEVINGPNGPVYGYFDRVKNTYEYLDDRHPAVRALFGIDEKGNVDPSKALIRNLYEEGMLGQSKGFNFFDAAYKNKTGERVPYEYFYNKARTRVVPKFYTKEDISGGKFDVLPEWYQSGYGSDLTKPAEIVTEDLSMQLDETTVNTNIENLQIANQNLETAGFELGKSLFTNVFSLADPGSVGYSPNLPVPLNIPIDDKGTTIYSLLSQKYGIDLTKKGVWNQDWNQDSFANAFNQLPSMQKISAIDDIENALSKISKTIDLNTEEGKKAMANIEHTKSALGQYKAAEEEVMTASSLVGMQIEEIANQLESNSEFDSYYRKYITATEKEGGKVIPKKEFLESMLLVSKIAEKDDIFLQALVNAITGDYIPSEEWLLKNHRLVSGIGTGVLSLLLPMAKLQTMGLTYSGLETSYDSTTKNIALRWIVEAKGLVDEKLAKGEIAYDEQVHYLYNPKTGDQHPLSKMMIEHFSNVGTNVKKGEKRVDVTTLNFIGPNGKKLNPNQVKDVNLSSVGFVAGRNGSEPYLVLTYNGKEAKTNGGAVRSTTKVKWESGSKNEDIFKNVSNMLINNAQNDSNKSAQGYAMYGYTMSKSSNDLFRKITYAFRQSRENRELEVSSHSVNTNSGTFNFKIEKITGLNKGDKGIINVVITDPSGKSKNVRKSDGGALTNPDDAMSIIGQILYNANGEKNVYQKEDKEGSSMGKYGQVWRP